MYVSFPVTLKQKIFKTVVLCLSEMLGTALLLFFGCLGCVINVHPVADYLFPAFNFGLAVALAVQVWVMVF